ncbi:MAG: hypothetical protein ACLFPQ_04450 [Candidatus Woesearchaeota archaeon]
MAEFDYKNRNHNELNDVNSYVFNKPSNKVRNFLKYWYVPLILVLIYVNFEKILFFGTLFVMILTSSIVSMYKRLVPVSLGLELITFYSAIISIAVNPVFGTVFALLLLFLEYLVQGNFCSFFFGKAIVYSVLCFIASALSPLGGIVAGIVILILRNLIFVGLTYVSNPGRVARDIPGVAINITLNFFLFSNFAVALLSSFA